MQELSKCGSGHYQRNVNMVIDPILINPVDAHWRNNILRVIYKVEIPAMQKRLFECVYNIDTEPMHTKKYREALTELEAFGQRHFI